VATSNGVFHSKTVRKYLQQIGVKHYSPSKKIVEEYKTRPNLFKQTIGNYFDNVTYPIELGFHFVRNSRRQFDFVNVVQIILDLLVAHNFIVDDNMKYVYPRNFAMNGQQYTIDKHNPGVYLKIMKENL
jgi:hypothetical protein